MGSERLKNIGLMVIDWYFPRLAKNICKSYWMESDKVHTDTSWNAYNVILL